MKIAVVISIIVISYLAYVQIRKSKSFAIILFFTTLTYLVYSILNKDVHRSNMISIPFYGTYFKFKHKDFSKKENILWLKYRFFYLSLFLFLTFVICKI